jgi:hypothetical protein
MASGFAHLTFMRRSFTRRLATGPRWVEAKGPPCASSAPRRCTPPRPIRRTVAAAAPHRAVLPRLGRPRPRASQPAAVRSARRGRARRAAGLRQPRSGQHAAPAPDRPRDPAGAVQGRARHLPRTAPLARPAGAAGAAPRHPHLDPDRLRPDVLVVDRHARGFLGELEPALDALVDTRVVLGLRDVLDSPAACGRSGTSAPRSRPWSAGTTRSGSTATGRLIPPLAAAGIVSPVPVRPVGYLRADRPEGTRTHLPADGRPYVLCTVGGGADGADVAAAVLAAGPPPGHRLVLVTGPQMPAAAQERLAAGSSSVRMTCCCCRFVHDLPTCSRARPPR